MATLRILAMSGYLGFWVATFYAFQKLPDIIPMHFNHLGEPDSFGKKMFVFILPVLLTFVYFLLGWASRTRTALNVPVKITDANRDYIYGQAHRMLVVLQLSIVIIFSILLYEIYTASLTGTALGGGYMIAVILSLVMGPVLFFVVRMMTHEPSTKS
jgi:hypothetical protein